MTDFNFSPGAGGPKPYNPADYGLPVWRDEDHLPPKETETAEQEPQTDAPAPVSAEPAAPGAIQRSVEWQLEKAADNRHGYSQADRWGPDYDCSSFVITAWEQAGVPVKQAGATYTGNMYEAFIRCGFEDVTAVCDLTTGAGLKYGDALLNHQRHTATYIGNGQLVHARSSEGNSLQGDQSGNEIRVQPYYNGPWDRVLRYTGANAGSIPAPEKRPILKKGMIGEDVRELQDMLVKLGYDTGGTDGKYGSKTFIAVAKLQEENHITPVDGEAGPVTMAVIDSLLEELPAVAESTPALHDTLAALAAYLQTEEFQQAFNDYIERSKEK